LIAVICLCCLLEDTPIDSIMRLMNVWRITGKIIRTTPKCIWRVSADGADIKRWWSKSESDTFKPRTLSLTSTRLLVTSWSASQLMQLDARGNELRRVQLPDNMKPCHVVESPTGTFIVSHRNNQLSQFQVSEVNTGGEVLRHFSGSRLTSLGLPHTSPSSLAATFL